MFDEIPVEVKPNPEPNKGCANRLMEDAMNDAQGPSRLSGEIHKSSLLASDNKPECQPPQNGFPWAHTLGNLAKVTVAGGAMAMDNPGNILWTNVSYAGLGAIQAYQDYNHLIHEKSIGGIAEDTAALVADAVLIGAGTSILFRSSAWNVSKTQELVYGAMAARALIKLVE